LVYDRALEHDEHEQSEQAVIPIFVQTPECNAENLEDEERGNTVLCEEGCECGDGDIEFVLVIQDAQVVSSGRLETDRGLVLC
jgi:hypothetical protein